MLVEVLDGLHGPAGGRRRAGADHRPAPLPGGSLPSREGGLRDGVGQILRILLDDHALREEKEIASSAKNMMYTE